MNLRFVEAFYWVATLKSISRAAEKLHLTQSAMSSRVAALELELGVSLLDRSKKQFRLTSAGTRFFAYAERLLDLQKEILAVVGVETARTLQLRVGAIESVLHSWLIPWMAQFRQEQPSLEFDLTVETTPVLVDQVGRGVLDLVFAALPSGDAGVRTKSLNAMPMVFIGNKQLHKKRRYAASELAQLELLTFQRGSQPHVALLDFLARANIQAKRIHTISSLSAMAQLVSGGFGVATLPKAATVSLVAASDLKVLSTVDQLAPLPIHASYRSDPGNDAIGLALQSALKFQSSIFSMKS